MDFEILEQFGFFFGADSAFDTSNGTNKCSNSDYFNTSVNIISIFLFVVSFIGNIATCFSVFCCGKLRKPTYILIASMSVADTCCLLMQRLGRSYYIVKHVLSFQAFLFVASAPFHVSTAHVIALSVLRLYMMKNPLEFMHKMTKKKTLLYIFACYLVGIVFGSVVYILFTQRGVKQKLTEILVSLAVMEIVIPQITLLTIHLIKVRVLLNSAVSQCYVMPHIRKLSKMTCIIILTNVLTILPLWIGVVALSLVKDHDKAIFVRCYYIATAFSFIILHHSINPIIFFFVSKPWKNFTCRESLRKRDKRIT